MSRRFPGQPSARHDACRQAYLELGPGRSLERLHASLQKRAQKESRPSPCTRLATLKRWCSEQNWVVDAVQYDADCAARRAEALAELERQQAQGDIALLQQTLRGAAGVAALVLGSYADAKTGRLLRPDAGLRDVATLLSPASRAGPAGCRPGAPRFHLHRL